MITILTGAIKNVGDYLISDRAKKLLRKYTDTNILELNRFDNIYPFLDEINESKALILCGGPAYASDIYPNVYPLVSDLNKIKVPIFPFSLGWCGQPIDDHLSFRFTSNSTDFLDKVQKNIPYSTCRDIITKEVLENNGISNVKIAGDPVWYDLDFIGKDFVKNEQVKKIVITTPAHQKYAQQTIRLIKLVKSLFPRSNLFLTYHRGIFPSRTTPPRKGLSYMYSGLVGKLLGVKVLDVSSDLNKIAFYSDCNLHIGYRVHAHLYFLSQRKPSILINEDGRGVGMNKSLNLPIYNANDQQLLDQLESNLKIGLYNGFDNFQSTKEIIDTTFKNQMLPYLKILKDL